jgi:hypothetical protein
MTTRVQVGQKYKLDAASSLLVLGHDSAVQSGINIVSESGLGLGAECYSADALASSLNFYKSRGTIATPASVDIDDALGSIVFYGYNGIENVKAAELVVTADDNATVDATFQFKIHGSTDVTPVIIGPITNVANDLHTKNIIISEDQTNNLPDSLYDYDLHIMGIDAKSTSQGMHSYGADNIFSMHRSGGERAATEPLGAGSSIGALRFSGDYNTTGSSYTGALINVRSASVWSATNAGTSITISTVADNQTVPEDRIHITGTGAVLLGPDVIEQTGDMVQVETMSIVDRGSLRLCEQAVNGAYSVSLRAPDSLDDSYTLVLPPADGTAGQVLTTDGSGQLGWASNDTTTTATVNTTDATPTTLAQFTAAANTMYAVLAKIAGKRTTTFDKAYFAEHKFMVLNDGTTTSILGSPVVTEILSAGDLPWLSAASIVMGDVVFTVTGEAATDVSWKIEYSFVEI